MKIVLCDHNDCKEESRILSLCSDQSDSDDEKNEEQGLLKIDDPDEDNQLESEDDEDEDEELDRLMHDLFGDRLSDEYDEDSEEDDEDFEEFLEHLLEDLDEDSDEKMDLEDYKELTLDRLKGMDSVINKLKKDIIPLAEKVLEVEDIDIPRNIGILIVGPKGTAKRHLAFSIINELRKTAEFDVYEFDVSNIKNNSEVLSSLKRLIKVRKDGEEDEEEKRPIAVVVRDIPQIESMENLFSDNSSLNELADILMRLMNERMDVPLVLIGTTVSKSNLPPELLSISIFPLIVETKFPSISETWKELAKDAGIQTVDFPQDVNITLGVEDVKHMLKLSYLKAKQEGRDKISKEDIYYSITIARDREGAFNLPVEVPNVTLSDFVGEKTLETVRNQLLLPLKYPQLASRYGIKLVRGVFVTGPMGCGKTHLARCIAGELKWPLVQLNVGSFGSEYLHAHERQLHMMVEEWLRRSDPMVVLMDEVDNLVPLEASREDWAARTGNMVLLEIERLLNREGAPLIVIAATSRPDEVNPALIRSGRLDLRIDLGFPNIEERERLFKLYLGEIGKELDVSDAAKLPYTPAEIKKIAERTLWVAFVRATKQGRATPPNQLDLQVALNQIPPHDRTLHHRGTVE